ncbi:Mitochondrial phosphate carrier protein [Colletotrichum asianum]
MAAGSPLPLYNSRQRHLYPKSERPRKPSGSHFAAGPLSTRFQNTKYIPRPRTNQKTVKMVLITRAISLTNFLVASSALGFQVFVLYPWHEQLSHDFEELKKEHLRVLDYVKGVDAGLRRGQGGAPAGQSLLERLGYKS